MTHEAPGPEADAPTPCQRCGAPGQVRHAPAAVPVSGTWCDACYARERWRLRLMRFAFPTAIVLLAVLTAWCRARG